LSPQGKGGVGKSLVSAALAQYFRHRKIIPHCFDTDPVNATFAQYQALEAIGSQIYRSRGRGLAVSKPYNPSGYQGSFKKVRATTLRKAGIPYVRIYDLRSTYATRLSAGGVADE
jgi:integrase